MPDRGNRRGGDPVCVGGADGLAVLGLAPNLNTVGHDRQPAGAEAGREHGELLPDDGRGRPEGGAEIGEESLAAAGPQAGGEPRQLDLKRFDRFRPRRGVVAGRSRPGASGSTGAATRAPGSGGTGAATGGSEL